jgi:hypothetical protein
MEKCVSVIGVAGRAWSAAGANGGALPRMIPKGASIALPSLSEVEVALRAVTEVLAHELASPTNRLPQWTEFEWRIARAVAALHGISSLLYRDVRWSCPEAWQRFLQEQQDQSVGRHMQITGLLESIDSQSRCDGVALMALKGAALHACGFYVAGERSMGDIDLLVRSEDAGGAARVLESCGYEAAFTSCRHQVFKPRVKKGSAPGAFGEHVDNPIKIEIHTRIAEFLPVTCGGHHPDPVGTSLTCGPQPLSINGIPHDAFVAACGRKHPRARLGSSSCMT